MTGMGWFVPVILSVISASTPLLLAATGELVAEKSGVLNLGIEGMMLVGAIVGFAVTLTTGSAVLGIAAAAAAGMGMAFCCCWRIRWQQVWRSRSSARASAPSSARASWAMACRRCPSSIFRS